MKVVTEQLTQRIAEVLRQEIMVKRSGVFINKADPEAVAEAVAAALQLTPERRKQLGSGVILRPESEGWPGAEDQIRYVTPWVEVQP